MPGEKILIVENEAPESSALEKSLRANGFTVVGVATRTDDAVRMALETAPDVILMDIALGDDEYGGIAAARELRRQGCASGIVFLTGINDSHVHNDVASIPDALFLLKPFFHEQVIALVRVSLGRRRGGKVVFVSYNHDDRRIVEEMLRFFNPLQDFGISPWSDQSVGPGEVWEPQIHQALDEAVAAVCMVSIGFLNSKYIGMKEWSRILRRHQDDGMPIIPAFLRPVPIDVLSARGLLSFQGVNRPEDPISSWSRSRREQCWSDLAGRLRKMNRS